jgi:hypothetical protein
VASDEACASGYEHVSSIRHFAADPIPASGTKRCADNFNDSVAAPYEALTKQPDQAALNAVPLNKSANRSRLVLLSDAQFDSEILSARGNERREAGLPRSGRGKEKLT